MQCDKQDERVEVVGDSTESKGIRRNGYFLPGFLGMNIV